MDNFRRPKRHKKSVAVDGVIQGRRPGLGLGGNDMPSKAAPKRSLGDFRQADGFHQAAGSGVIEPHIPKHSANPLVPPAPAEPLSKLLDRKPAKLKKGHNWRKIAKRASIGMGACALLIMLIGGGLVTQAYFKSRKVLRGGGGAAALRKNVEPSLLRGEGDGRVNVLLLGKGGPGHEAPDLTDTLIIASIDPIHKEASLFSLPRDLWIRVPGDGNMKINAVYATAKQRVLNKRRYSNQAEDAEKAGLDAIEQTMQNTLGIPIHYYTMIDFEAFRKSIDTVGGVDIVAKEALYDPTVAWENGRNPLIAKAGPNHFDGKRALLYARSRHTSTRGDFDRSERQRLIIIALKDKVLSAGTYGNPIKISQLISAFGDHVRTNFTTDEIKRLYDLSKGIQSTKITSLSLVDPPNILVTTGMINGQSVVLPRAGNGNFKEIQSFVRNTLRDPYLKSENASVTVLNGTTVPGLATARAEELKSYGYTIAQIADAPTKDYAKTTLIDLRNGTKKYTKHYLETRLKTTATGKLPVGVTPGAADFVIILGQNETPH